MRKALKCKPSPALTVLYCNLAKLHPLGVYIVHDCSSQVLSFVSLYFAVVIELRLTYQYSCNNASDLLALLFCQTCHLKTPR